MLNLRKRQLKTDNFIIKYIIQLVEYPYFDTANNELNMGAWIFQTCMNTNLHNLTETLA